MNLHDILFVFARISQLFSLFSVCVHVCFIACFINNTLIKLLAIYCKSGNFCENFIFANGIKRHICDV